MVTLLLTYNEKLKKVYSFKIKIKPNFYNFKPYYLSKLKKIIFAVSLMSYTIISLDIKIFLIIESYI